MKIPRYHARADWASDREAAAGARFIHPVWFSEDGPQGDGWSIVLTVKEPVAFGDKRSRATVHFLMPGAPHHHLKPGVSIELLAGKTPVARVLLGEADGFVESDA